MIRAGKMTPRRALSMAPAGLLLIFYQIRTITGLCIEALKHPGPGVSPSCGTQQCWVEAVQTRVVQTLQFTIRTVAPQHGGASMDCPVDSCSLLAACCTSVALYSSVVSSSVRFRLPGIRRRIAPWRVGQTAERPCKNHRARIRACQCPGPFLTANVIGR